MAPTCEFDRLFQRRVVHILEMIFFSLDYKTFKNSLEVSKSWKALLTSEYLQKRGKDVYSGEIKKELLISAKEGNVHKIKLILFNFGVDGAQLNMTDHKGSTPLLNAARGGHKDVTLLLLEKGAQPNVADEDGHTPVASWATSCSS